MAPSEQDHLPVRAAAPRAPSDGLLVAAPRAPSDGLLAAVAAGLTAVAAEPCPEWSGVPTQRRAPSLSDAAVPVPLPARPVRPAAATLPTFATLPALAALPTRPRRS